MKIHYLALVVLSLAIACTKEDTPEETPDVRYVSSIASTKDSTAYEYTADRKLKREAIFSDGNTDSITILQYTGGILTGINFTHDASNTIGTPRYSVTYNADNRIDVIRTSDGTAYDSVAYNTQGQVIEHYYRTTSGLWWHNARLTWKDGNVIMVVMASQWSGSQFDTLTYTYDNHPNILLPRASLSLKMGNEFHHLSKNNVTRIDYNYVGNRDNDYYIFETFAYEYDEHNYPVKRIFANGRIQYGDTAFRVRDSSRITYLP